MATYAIGDIQGCFNAFNALLTRINFDVKHDKLWLVGDIINRGLGSLEVLRWCYTHQNIIQMVLGNHDLHALAVAYGFAPLHKKDTLTELLVAPDREQLLTWLRHQPLAYREKNYLMVHAGLLPQWTANDALALSAEVEAELQGANYLEFLANMYGNKPCQWNVQLTGMPRLRLITNAMTRLRVCDAEGVMEFKFKGIKADIPAPYHAWFDLSNRQSQDVDIIFGHWSALDAGKGKACIQQRKNVYALDTGCLWGGYLSVLCLETKMITQEPSHLSDTNRN